MPTFPFNSGWSVGRDGEPFEPVELPHDAMIHERRTADAPAWAHGGFFLGGRYRYRKSWTPDFEIADRQVSLRFEGVYRHSRVLLDGVEVGGAVNGYQEFEVRLDPVLRAGAEHTIEVEVDNSAMPNARWYTGSGIYRPVWLEVREPVHIVPGGIGINTTFHGATASVRIDVALTNFASSEAVVQIALARDGGVAAQATAVTHGHGVAVELEVPDAALWSADDPARYDLKVQILVGGQEQDRVRLPVGLRTVALDPKRGLLVNGRVVELRGANVHHDNGVIGAATFPGSELRRIRILREAGFNAVRSAHNPASRALLEACDSLGMYVMDEAFDGWYDHKNDHDDAEQFDEVWRGVLAAMVRKDRTSPSVIMYSVGNENGEALEPRGRRLAHAMATDLRALDPSRLVTLGVNSLAATFAGLGSRYDKEPGSSAPKGAPDMTSTALNVLSSRFGTLSKIVPRLKASDRATVELWTGFDVAGYNYGSVRYERDAALHPERMIVGTETMPGDIATNWALVKRLPTVIGDFLWAGWDYIGEAGAGSWAYGSKRAPFMKEYPQLTSGMGVFDITGQPDAAILLCRAAWGMLDAPAITVRPLDVAAGPVAKTGWRATDAMPSWSWVGHEGRNVDLEIYSTADEVEVRINGRSLGRQPAGPSHGFLARFNDRFEPGVVEAVGYRAGRQVARSTLRTAGAARLRLEVEEPLGADPLDVAHVRIELADDDGIVDTAATDLVTVEVDGPAVLAGLGTGAWATEESFTASRHTTHRGRALAVVRSTGRPGPVSITVTSQSYGSQTADLTPALTSRTLP